MTGDVNYDSNGQYTFWQDDEIQAFLTAYADEPIERAIGYAYLAIAAMYATEAEMIKTYDLQIDSRQKSSSMTAIANAWFKRADDKDELEGLTSDLFYVKLSGDDCVCVPEAAVYPVRTKCKCA